MITCDEIIHKARKISDSVTNNSQIDSAVKWLDLAIDQICILEDDFSLNQIFSMKEKLLDKWSY